MKIKYSCTSKRGCNSFVGLAFTTALTLGIVEMSWADGFCLSDTTGVASSSVGVVNPSIGVSSLQATDCGFGDKDLISVKGKSSRWNINNNNTSFSASGTPEALDWNSYMKIEFVDGETWISESYPAESGIDLAGLSCDAEGDKECPSGAFSFTAAGPTLIMIKAGLTVGWFYYETLKGDVIATWNTNNEMFDGADLSLGIVFQ